MRRYGSECNQEAYAMSATLPVHGADNVTVSLADDIFERTRSAGAIYYSLVAERANARQGTGAAKNRANVTGSGAKPWRQKGTGRARAGSRKSPLWVGGGVIFGPHPRTYTVRIPPKQKKAAIYSLLSFHNQQKSLLVINAVSVTEGKTKELLNVVDSNFKDIHCGRHAIVLIIDNNNPGSGLVRQAARNIPAFTVHSYDQLAVRALVHADYIIFSLDALHKMQNTTALPTQSSAANEERE